MDQSKHLQYLSLLKHQFASQETLLEYHLKAEAMLKMILAQDLAVYAQETLHHYLWALSDLVGKGREFNGELLDMLGEIMPLLEMSDNSNVSTQKKFKV